MRPYFNTFLRYIWIFIILLLVGPVLAAVTFRPLSHYTVKAALWVDQPLYVENQRSKEGDIYETAATNQANYLQELVSTGSYIDQVAKALVAKGYDLENPTSKQQFFINISKEFKITPVGNHLIKIEYNDIDRELTLLTTQNIIDNYYNLITQRVKDQGEKSLNLLEQQVQDAQKQVDKAAHDVQQYASEHPGLTGRNIDVEEQASSLRPEDLEYNSRLQTEKNARWRYEQLNQQLEQIRVSYGAFQTGQDTIVKIQDQPVVTESVTYTGLSTLLTGGLLGLIAGLMLTVLAALVATWTDKSFYEKSSLRRNLRIESVLDLPEVYPVGGLRRRWRKKFCIRRSYAKELNWSSK
jgi:uncharacterized protein involved in exopolysaccharide biosynthesis